MPPIGEHQQRLDTVLRVLYLIFNEGYVSTAGTELLRSELAVEAIRLTRITRGMLPDESEVAGLFALMLLTHARYLARTGLDGALIPMAEQDRTKWDRAAIAEGVELLKDALPHGPTGPYQIQAAIAALHDEAETFGDTDWRQISTLYKVLLEMQSNPVVTLNYAVAVAMAEGPEAGLNILSRLVGDGRVNESRRYFAVRAHILEMIGELAAALHYYELASQRALNLHQRRFLNSQIDRLTSKLSILPTGLDPRVLTLAAAAIDEGNTVWSDILARAATQPGEFQSANSR